MHTRKLRRLLVRIGAGLRISLKCFNERGFTINEVCLWIKNQ